MELELHKSNIGPKAIKKQGGLRTMPFIFANEVAEKLAVVGFSANMVSYLTQQLNMPLTKAATTLSNFGGTASLTPLLGAFLADAYAGRFWTITVGSLFYQMGMVLLTISAVLPHFRPPLCHGPHAVTTTCETASTWQISVLYTAFLLNCLGGGGIRPCVVAFGADQFDENDPNEKTKTWNFFNWYYFCMGVSILLAVTVVVYIQDNVGWGWGLGIPSIAMGLSLISFVAGFPMYRMMEPSGSPFTRLVQVVVAAVKKRKVVVEEGSVFYENEALDGPISLGGKLVHTNQLSFFDKAAIITDADEVTGSLSPSSSKPEPNLWRISTVHRVEELKSIIRMGPIWLAGILVITASAQQGTFSLQQARTMDRRIVSTSSFLVPPGSMTVFTMLAMLSTISIYDRLLIPLARRFTGLDRGISFLHRMGIGMAVSILATLVAGFVEVHRRQTAANNNLIDNTTATIPLTFYWLVPQYALHGIAEAFMSIGHLEFFYDQAPESMRSTATALFWMVISAGSYLSTMLVTILHHYTDWLPDNINRGKLEYLYWLITILQILNLVYYMVCAKFYTFKPVQVHQWKGDNGEDESVEVSIKA